MPGTFFGIEIGQRGLQAAQIGQDTVGHNIANASTPGYSDQRVNLVASDPYTNPDAADTVHTGMLGSGVQAASITRAQDQFLNVQVWNGTSALSNQTTQRDALAQVQGAFGEPSTTGLSSAMSKFFGSMNDLVSNPEDLGIRTTVVQSGNAMAQTFANIQGQLTGINQQLSNKTTADMSALNSYGQQIAALNVTIRQSVAQGLQPNDLLDRRDALVADISGLANATVLSKSDGTINVSIGTTDLVTGTDSYTLTQPALVARGDLQGGELGGIISAQTDVSGYQTSLDTLASQTITQINNIHKGGAGLDGTTNLNFFTGTTAATMAVNPQLVANPQQVAAAALPPPGQPVPPGDATNAIAMAALENQKISGTGTALDGSTLSSFYTAMVADSGAKGQAATTSADSATASLNQLTQQKNTVTGVSTDNEMIDMMRYQRAYQASAKVVQTMDSMIGTLITGLFSN